MSDETGFSAEVRALVTARATIDGVPICERCLAEPVEQLHHRCPRQRGGSRHTAWINLPSNAAGLGSRCHAWVESFRTAAKITGWLVPRGVAERLDGCAAVVVVDELQRSWRFHDDGTKSRLFADNEEEGF